MFLIVALYSCGEYEKAWELAKMMFTFADFNPLAANCGAEPYAFTNQFLGPRSPFPKTSPVGWITGTASWMNQVLLKYLPGVIPGYNGLKITPSLPREIGKLKMKRRFRDAEYNFDIAIDAEMPKDQMLITLNGKPLEKPFIPIALAGSINNVKVRYNSS